MQYLGNDRNLVRAATLSMTNVVASNAIERTDEDEKIGGGTVTLTGPYTGAADTVIEVKIVDTTVTGTPAISAPVFSGIGNGTMTAVSATSGMAAEIFTVSLEDTGTETRQAEVPFQSAILRAIASGVSGNDIRVTIDQSGLSFSDTDFSLRNDLSVGVNEYFGDEWNFGAVYLTADGKVPGNAPRLKFGDDPQVYRAYRTYKNNRFVYGFSPSPVRTVNAGAKVFSVSGDREITISDGTTTETYSSLITLYDALNAIRGVSSLVEVIGAVVNDSAPNGQNAVDLSVYTQSYAATIIKDGSDSVKAANIDLVIDNDAPTETLSITKIDGNLWSVKGDVSGTLSTAITNVLYDDGDYQFKIPNPPGDPNATGATIYPEFIPQPRDGEYPSIRFIKPRVGSAARNGTFEFVWTEKPADPCDPTTGEFEGGPSDECLGTSETPEGVTVSDANVLRRVQQLSTFVKEFTRVNTRLYAAASNDIDFINKAASIHLKGINALAGGTLNYPIWVTGHVYAVDTIVEPTVDSGFRYAITDAGTAGASEPTWPTTIGSSVTADGVTYLNIGKKPLLMWDDALLDLKSDAHVLSAVGTLTIMSEWQALATLPADISAYMVPLTKNGKFYYAPAGTGTTGASEPTYSSSFTDGSVDWIEGGTYRVDSHVYPARSVLVHPLYGVFQTVLGGTSSASEPDFKPYISSLASPTGLVEVKTITDGTVIWEFLGASNVTDEAGSIVTNGNLPSAVNDDWYQRYNSAMNDILAAAGLQGNFDVTNGGDGCWSEDEEQTGWFVYQGSDTPPYMPMQTGHYYHSSKPANVDGREIINSTHEFGVGLQVCGDFIDGDKISITINGINGVNGGYQNGDQIVALVTHAEPLELGGGQTGDDTLTWSVIGSATGRYDDYALVTTAPVAYSDGGIGFLISTGGVPFKLGDSFTFGLEGGHFQWRRDGGSYSASVAIAATAALADGLVANFAGGVPPSWATDDKWTFSARALNGADNLRQPTDRRTTWATSTAITITPATTAITELAIYDHTIPSGATITLQGSDDNFATTPLNQVITWRERDIAVAITASRAKYRLNVSTAGSIQWLWLGTPLQAAIVSGLVELGFMTKVRRMPGLTRRRGLGVKVEHTALSSSSANGIVDMLESACELDACRIGIVTKDGIPALVQVDAESIELNDIFGFRPTDTTDSLVSLSLELAPAP